MASNVILGEHEARQACLADGVDPDIVIKGRKAWKLYTVAPAGAPEPDALTPEERGLFQDLASIHDRMVTLENSANHICTKLGATLKGRRIATHGGVYQIDYITAHYMGRISAHGKKITADGKLGSKSWDLRNIYPHMFKDSK